MTDKSLKLPNIRSLLSRNMLILGIGLGIAAFTQPAAAKLYKWVDDNGITHYGETIPPEYADKDRVELNKSGREVKTEEVLTPERRAAMREEEEQKKEAEQAAVEKQRYDKMLTSTYSSVNEIELARKRNLQQIDARINTLNTFMNTANKRLQDLQNEAEGYTKRNQAIPAYLSEELKQAQDRVDKLNNDMAQPQAEKAAINARFDADKARYIELTGKTK